MLLAMLVVVDVMVFPPPLPRTNRTHLVPPPVLTGHAASILY